MIVAVLMMLGLLSCNSEQMLVHEIEKEVEVFVEVPNECEVVEEVIVVEDTAFDFSDIWVDSFTQVASLDGVDIFWVIDPSGSMSDEQAQIMNGITQMMASLPEVGWRLMIISSDHRYVNSLTTFPIVPGDTLADVEAMYTAHVNGGYEAGFDALYEYIVLNHYAPTWLRNDASLLVVFVSDEEEQSREHFDNLYQFIGWISGYRQQVNIASIVNVEQADSVCLAPPMGMNIGHDYMEVTNYFSGNIIDICATDWSAGVAEASNQITPHEWIDLTHVPLDPNWIFVYVDGAIFNDWRYEASENRVYFGTIPSANSLVEVVYNY